MELSRFFWASGLALLVGGILYSAAWILFAAFDAKHNQYTGSLWIPLNLLVIAGAILIALGLPGFYAYQAERAGLLGLIGMVMMFVGLLLAGVAGQAVETYTLPHLARLLPAVTPGVPPDARLLFNIAGPLLFLGIVVTGAVTWRAGVYPRWAGIALIVAALAGLVATYVPMPAWLRWSMPALYSATLAWLGFSLMSDS